MFPGLPDTATNVFEMDQAKDYQFKYLTRGTQNGACSGLSFLWIKQHRIGNIEQFKTTIMQAEFADEISAIHSTDKTVADDAWLRFFAAAKLKRSTITNFDEIASPGEAATSLAVVPESFQLISYENGSGRKHTIAIARINVTVEIFDANHGQARFRGVDSFRTWFKDHYWNTPSGPNNPAYCSSFMSVVLVDDDW